MLGRWLSRWREHREGRLLRDRAIPDALWQLTLVRHPFLSRRSDAEREALRRLATLFLAEKEFTAVQGLTLTDEMAVAIAAQACLPILGLGLGLVPYADFVGVVIHPAEVIARREVMDDDGVVHEYDEVLSGEAMHGGPVTLSWEDVEQAGESAEFGYNVVIHEFVHKIDMLDGDADGVPGLLDRSRREHWIDVLDNAYQTFCSDLDEGVSTFLDPYAQEGPGEFFAVAAECFFVAPLEFQREHPQLYVLFSEYFRQDPLKELRG